MELFSPCERDRRPCGESGASVSGARPKAERSLDPRRLKKKNETREFPAFFLNSRISGPSRCRVLTWTTQSSWEACSAICQSSRSVSMATSSLPDTASSARWVVPWPPDHPGRGLTREVWSPKATTNSLIFVTATTNFSAVLYLGGHGIPEQFRYLIIYLLNLKSKHCWYFHKCLLSLKNYTCFSSGSTDSHRNSASVVSCGKDQRRIVQFSILFLISYLV